MSAGEAQSRFEAALASHQTGDLAAAAAGYRMVLAQSPDYLPALHGLALVAIDRGEIDTAIPLLARCVSAAPNDVGYRSSLGHALLRIGKAEAAAVALLPAANAAPQALEPRLLLARALGELGRWREAYDIVVTLTAAFPRAGEAWAWRGSCASKLRILDDAESSLREAMNLRPADTESWINLGVVLRAQGRLQESAAAYRSALGQQPDNAIAHGNLGNVLGDLGDAAGAEESLRRAVALDPNGADAHYNLGALLVRKDAPDEAILHLRQVLTKQPDRCDALVNLGVALVARGDFDAAEDCYRRALALAPGNPEAHYDLAWLLLLTGRWEEGWRAYEWRWEMPTFSSRRRHFSVPRWDGQPLRGTIVLHAEQGLGDAIQFVRFAGLVKQRCDRVVLQCSQALFRLFALATAVGALKADAVVTFRDSLPDHVAHAPLMSLPWLLGTTPATVPASVPYLQAPVPVPPELLLPRTGRRRIGLVWAGSPDNRMDRRRVIAAAAFAPLFAAAPADFVGLQVGPQAEEASAFPGLVWAAEGKVRDFADTAAVIGQLDLVIGVDTAVLHLAGALAKPAWILLPSAPDYRWLLGRADTPWYPTARLFRQERPGDWPGVIAAVTQALTRW